MVVGVAVVGLAGVFVLGSGGGGTGGASAASSSPGAYAYAVGQPGPGAQAPALRLPSTTDTTWDLAAQRGKTTLLYFHEGLMCPPCLEQISDIETNWSQFEDLGIDKMVAISGDELGNLRQAAKDLELYTPLLSDPGVEQSTTWEANKYGMMGTTHNGHSFVVVGPEGEIAWRADYGGSPNYTMYVPVANPLADLRAGLNGAAQGQAGA